MIYLMWYDDSPRRTIAQKIADARAAYKERYKVESNVALISPADVADGLGDNVMVKPTVGRHTIWVGRQEGDE